MLTWLVVAMLLGFGARVGGRIGMRAEGCRRGSQARSYARLSGAARADSHADQLAGPSPRRRRSAQELASRRTRRETRRSRSRSGRQPRKPATGSPWRGRLWPLTSFGWCCRNPSGIGVEHSLDDAKEADEKPGEDAERPLQAKPAATRRPSRRSSDRTNTSTTPVADLTAGMCAGLSISTNGKTRAPRPSANLIYGQHVLAFRVPRETTSSRWRSYSLA
jgi:hypothetical protein